MYLSVGTPRCIVWVITTVVPADSEDDPLKKAAYVIGSRYRKITVRELESSPKTPSQIADRNGVQRPHVSRALTELQQKSLVVSHGGDSRTKLYSLTDQGASVAELVSEIDSSEGTNE